jgi:tetratricopeptide (TPR) repeat protein
MILRPAGVSTMLTVEGRKSQIAIEYAYQFRDQHPKAHVLWVYAANETRFVQAYRETAQNLRLPGCDDPQVNVCKVVCEWLNDTEDVPWLMVLDNADRTANFLPIENETTAEISAISTYMASYLPTKFNHSQFLLVTTRIRDIGEHLSRGQPCVSVGPFSAQEARDLLQAKLRVLDDCSTPAMDTLVEILGRIPLAITQAAAFINRNKISVQEYVRELDLGKQNFMQYLSKDLQDPRREPGFPNSVFRTWKLSFDQIQTDCPRAAEILSLMAMLDGQKIPVDLVRKDEERRVDFQTVIGTLDGYSMINKEVGGKTCTIHPLVQLSVQYILEESGQIVFYTGQAVQLIADRFPVGEHENKAVCESLLPHAQAVLQPDTKSDATATSRARLLHNVGWFEWRQGRYNSAYQNVLAAYEIRQRISGSETDAIRSLHILALVLRDQGKYEVAEEMNRRALAGFEKVLGMEHPNTLASVNNLASVLRYQGKYEVAEEMNRRALAGREKMLGVEHPNTLTSVENLASVLRYQGKYEMAEEMNRRALAGKEKVLGVDHPETLISVNNLASVLRYQGKYEAAEEMNRRALAGYEKVLGVDHPDTLTSVDNLASVLQYQGKYKAAEEMNRRALEGYEKVLGVEHPDTLTSVGNLASVLQDQGKYEAAEEMNRRVLAGREKVLGVEHPNTLTSVSNLALVLQDQGKYEAAEEMNRRALAGREKVLGVEHPDTLTSVYCLAYILYSRRQLQQAAILYRRALSGYQQTLGPTHPTTLACDGHYSSMLQEMEDEERK